MSWSGSLANRRSCRVIRPSLARGCAIPVCRLVWGSPSVLLRSISVQGEIPFVQGEILSVQSENGCGSSFLSENGNDCVSSSSQNETPSSQSESGNENDCDRDATLCASSPWSGGGMKNDSNREHDTHECDCALHDSPIPCHPSTSGRASYRRSEQTRRSHSPHERKNTAPLPPSSCGPSGPACHAAISMQTCQLQWYGR